MLGAQEPRVQHVPECVTNGADEVIELAERAGLILDPWQRHVLIGGMGEVPLIDHAGIIVPGEWRWAAQSVCVLVSRQNGKGAVLEARELAGLLLLEEETIVHSAHEQSTSSEHMRRLVQLINGMPEYRHRVKKIVEGKGREAIEMKNGQRILFKTRTAGGGRGFTGDLVVIDEAYDFPAAAAAALVPTMSARPNVQIWYASSAVDQEKNPDGEELARQRELGMKKTPGMAFFDWSCEGDDPSKVAAEVMDDPFAWAQANPAMGRRITEGWIRGERDRLLGAREFAVERLGIGDWPSLDEDAARVIPRNLWESLREHDQDQRIQTNLTFSLDVNPDRTHGSIGVAGMRSDSLWQFAVADHRPGTNWMVETIEALVQGRSATPIVILSRGPASNMIDDLEQKGLNIVRCGIHEYTDACSDFFDTVGHRECRYPFPQPDLDDSLTGAKRSTGENAWYWSRRASTSPDISPLVSVTLALWGAQHMSAPTVWSLAEVLQQAGLTPGATQQDAQPSVEAPPKPPATPGFVSLNDMPRGRF